MALDTKYRPQVYSDVLGQEATSDILRQYVKEGRGFHQSYVICGQHGSGKTTTGRILARSLLCPTPVNGEACDKCSSCVGILSGKGHECFEEFDAASNSGKSDLDRIIEDIPYSTFSGKRRVYLVDESHRLSVAAVNRLLKPTEDSVPGSEDKQLVVIFCTTAPEKMDSAIFSRCAPALVIRVVEPEEIAKRLAWVCDQEKIPYEMEALVSVAELSHSHIRDSLKTVEGVSLLGGVTLETLSKYLRLDANDLAADIILGIGSSDLKSVLEKAAELSRIVSPSDAYERLAEISVTAFRSHLKVGKVQSHWPKAKIEEISKMGVSLLGIASRFASPPHRPNSSTLSLDLAAAHYAVLQGVSPEDIRTLVVEESRPSPRKTDPAPQSYVAPVVSALPAGTVKSGGASPPNPTRSEMNEGGVWIDHRAVKRTGSNSPESSTNSLQAEVFRDLVRFHLRSMIRGGKG